jgi:hypothetical protein
VGAFLQIPFVSAAATEKKTSTRVKENEGEKNNSNQSFLVWFLMSVAIAIAFCIGEHTAFFSFILRGECIIK